MDWETRLTHEQACLFPCVLVLSCWNCTGQTNGTSGPVRLHSLPAPQLRQPASQVRHSALVSDPADDNVSSLLAPADSDRISTNTASATSAAPLLDQMTWTSRASSYDFRMFYRLDKAGYLTPAKLTSDNRFVRFVDNTFQPEGIHFRKVDLSCSLITAIKRKNPLCLLNPLFFNLSW